MKQVQGYLFSNGFIIAEVLPQFHHYHLDDNPDLTSCSLVAVRYENEGLKSDSEALPKSDLQNFYGACAPLDVRYVLDRRKGGALPSFDHYAEPLVYEG